MKRKLIIRHEYPVKNEPLLAIQLFRRAYMKDMFNLFYILEVYFFFHRVAVFVKPVWEDN